MRTHFDDLSKNLASSMSRRTAARTFLGALGGAALAAFAGKSAFADTSATCDTWCASQANLFLQMCLTASANCPEGMCASVLPTLPTSSPVTSTNINGRGVGINGSTATTSPAVPQYCVVIVSSVLKTAPVVTGGGTLSPVSGPITTTPVTGTGSTSSPGSTGSSTGTSTGTTSGSSSSPTGTGTTTSSGGN